MLISEIKQRILKSLFYCGLILMGSACTDTVELDLPENDAQLVVDGWIYNDPAVASQVKLSWTSPYFSNEEPPPVSGATIRLFEDGDFIEKLEESATEKGLYPITSLGEMGKTYYLEVTTPDGNSFRSLPETITRVHEITDIYYKYQPESSNSTEGYSVFIDTKEPAGKGDYYRWKYSVDGTYQRESSDLFFAEDDLVDGNDILDLEISYPIIFTTSEKAEFNENGVPIDKETGSVLDFDIIIDQDSTLIRIEQISVSSNAFQFFQVLNEQTAFIGGLFDPPPAPIKGNIVQADDPNKYTLGFFGASAVEWAEVWVADDENMADNQ